MNPYSQHAHMHGYSLDSWFLCQKSSLWIPAHHFEMVQSPSYQEGLNCCVFWPAFGCCAHLKAGWNTFLSHFNLFSSLKWRKKVKTAWKSILTSSQMCPAPKSWPKHTTKCIKIGSCISSIPQLSSGVPKGAILSPPRYFYFTVNFRIFEVLF